MSLATFSAPSLDDLLHVSVDAAAGTIRLSGGFDHCSAPLLVDNLSVLAAGPATWSVDATAVTSCDGGGLAALIRTRDVAVAQGRRFRLVGASRCVRRLIDVAGVQHLLLPAPAPAPR
jgi:anti-sigma B factor antagonist